MQVKAQVALPLIYDNAHLDIGYRINLLVENKVITEIKSVEHLAEVHHKPVLTYLQLSGLKLGMLVNFNCAEIEKEIFRKVHGLQPGFSRRLPQINAENAGFTLRLSAAICGKPCI